MLEFHNVTEVYSKREQQLSLLESRNLKKKSINVYLTVLTSPNC